MQEALLLSEREAQRVAMEEENLQSVLENSLAEEERRRAMEVADYRRNMRVATERSREQVSHFHSHTGT